MSKGPVLIELDEAVPGPGGPRPGAAQSKAKGTFGAEDAEARPSGGRLIEALPPAASPADAPPVDAPPAGAAIRRLEVMATRRRSRLGAWALRLGASLALFLAGLAFWELVTDLLARSPVLGWTAAALAGAFVLVLIAIAAREAAAFARLARLDALQRAADAARTGTAQEARDVARCVAALYAGRPALRAPAAALPAEAAEMLDADAILDLAERRLLGPLDAAALREVEGAARQVAVVTAFVPLALADILAAGTLSVRMIRRVAEIYGGRAGTLGNLRLVRAVFAHLAATGAVAAGDDLVHSALGGNLLARLSRRFGEGLVNGALTARVGVAAIEVCRPLPFAALKRPSVTSIVRGSLTGLFDASGREPR